ncbi:hypothetical protein D0Z07_9023 [Hyphodiscus hymeniophilus]|uniref:Eisosome protein 1 n=1 Tax=Hyphodiscus hymeniophilus TaxID=353542 RepID=A0A9P6SJX9_9HELO|nr:hypothetical protein D0Z07_9023 [Hyphodiscus hymeniophilus]
MASTTAGAQGAPKSHPTSAKLEDQAATAALYVTQYDKSSKNGQEFLDGHHRLSSAGAAASLKYANPQDLPSYPSSGLKKNDSAAGTAASLGWANQKPFEHWKPDPSASASAAAMMAKDYKMKELWQPEQSTYGAKAALLAHKDGGKVDIWRPEAESAWGNSAAAQAFKKFGAGGLSPVLDYGYTDLGRKGSLMAATGAMSQSRQRAISTPDPRPKLETYPDESNAVTNALSAANSAHRTKKKSESSEAGTVPYTNMSREMYTSHPPVAPEIDEKNRADTLRASAIAMAKQMYNIQQKQIDQTSDAHRGAVAAHRRKSSSSDESDEVQPMRFNNLQEAAHKLAQERLAKLHDEHAQNREYLDYYGGNKPQPQSRLSIRGRPRRRASSDGGMDEDREQSNKIRAQMSIFSSNVTQVDEKKRAQDREALIAAAQRNVTKRLHGMDERVFADTGKVGPSLLSEWEVKAHAAAQAKSDSRMENYGKVHIGGGKFIDQSAVDAVARSNVQPVLDEINEKAAAEHERQAAIKAEQLETTRKASERKQREKESKAINKKLKQQDKDEERLRIQEEKDEQKAAQRASKERRKSGTAGGITEPEDSVAAPTAVSATGAGATAAAATEAEELTPTTTARETPLPIRTSMEDQASLRMQENADAANKGESTPLSPDSGSPDKGKSRVSWLKTKFSKRLSRTPKGGEKEGTKEEKGFVGGAALTGASADNSNASLGAGNRDSVSTAPKTTETETVPAEISPSTDEVKHPEVIPEPETSATIDPATEFEEPAILPLAPEIQEPTLENDEERKGRPSEREEVATPVSPLEDEDELENEDEEFQEARDNFDEDLAPPPTFPAAKSSSPAREAKFTEVID